LRLLDITSDSDCQPVRFAALAAGWIANEKGETRDMKGMTQGNENRIIFAPERRKLVPYSDM
jgi:hypothetical protein